MGRKKVKLAFILNESRRKEAYRRRKEGLLTKVNELSTLCGVDACAIVYSPYHSKPETWPSTIDVQRVLSRFTNMPDIEVRKKMLDQETFLRQMIGRVNEQLRKQRIQNRDKEITELMFQCVLTGSNLLDNLLPRDLTELASKIEHKLNDVNSKIDADAATNMVVVQEQNHLPQWFSDVMNNST